LLEERSKAFKHIGDVLKALEETENDFVSSLEASRSYLSDSDAGFAAAMEDGLRELGEMANPATADMELLCRRLSEKVAHLHSCVQQKRRLDQARLDALTEARRQAERRLDKRRRDYEDFSRQSHAMLKEIENLRAVSLKDPLTDVYNRRAYDDQIIKTLAELRKEVLKTCSMIVFDIDLFRDFNNVYGHLAGDRVLAYVARLTQETLRADDLIFRYGGDEFVVLMPNAGLKAAAVVAEKIRRAINAVEFKLFKNSEVTVRLSMSMGVSEARLDDDPAGFFARADKAMYAAKAAGRNRVSVADD
ncbi:MAG: GGDEF domain-containing protein, partial [Candidatus Adiutrix sp.]|nr:GGDEF domain-containing protein [Candidatus Adiutrix sp.]